MKLYRVDLDKPYNRNVNVLVEKIKGRKEDKIKWEFSFEFWDERNKTKIVQAENETLAINTFIHNELDWHRDWHGYEIKMYLTKLKF